MSYATISAALHDILSAVSGIQLVLEHEPQAVQATPMIYSLLESMARDYADDGGTVRVTYRTMHRLVLRWQNPEECEKQVRLFVDSIPAAIDAEMRTLGGHLIVGVAVITGAETDWVIVGGTEYRRIDFYSEVQEQQAVA